MQRVIVSVERADGGESRDLELPAEIDAGRLAGLIASALRWTTDWSGQPVRYQIEAHPLGRPLQPHETLAGAGVWDGARLVLCPIGTPRSRQQPPPRTSGPVTGWRSISAHPADASDQPADAQPAPGFAWKPVDE
jgi:hypothetical protein